MTTAAEGFGRAAVLAPDNPVFVNAWGESLLDLGRSDEAMNCFQTAIRLRPSYARAHNNLGRLLHQRGDLPAAEKSFTHAIALNPKYPTAHNNLGGVLLERGQKAAAIEHFREALAHRPEYPEAQFNWGAALRSMGDPAAAAVHLQEAIRLRPGYGRAHLMLGQTLVDLGQVATSAASFEAAIRLQPQDPHSHRELGSVLMLLNRLEDARAAFERALALSPQSHETFAQLFRLKEVLCDWTNRAEQLEQLWANTAGELEAGRTASLNPLYAAPLPWSGSQLLAIARGYAKAYERSVAPLDTPAALTTSGRIKIGYLSRDFYDHAVAHQLQGLFAPHDRSRFEIHVYSFGPDDGSTYRQRIVRDAEHFHDATGLSVIETARAIRADGVHILVDLMGYTGLARTPCVAMRPAPIQVNWLGYPGTMGAEFIDYLIGDAVVTPVEHAEAYSERLVRLPHSYMPTDREQPVAAHAAGRGDHGLPDDATVFCCFHNTHKIDPDIFGVWMRIMGRVPGSVAWLNVRHPGTRDNLRREASGRGVDPERLVFAEHVPSKANHLARLRLADLFLDTLHYNAHVTACDALWAGLPVLSCPGETFASRVGASLLTASGMTELIAKNIEEYERRAVELASDREKLTELRHRLDSQKMSSPLFDTPRFVRNLEKAFLQMWEAHVAGQPPRAIDVME